MDQKPFSSLDIHKQDVTSFDPREMKLKDELTQPKDYSRLSASLQKKGEKHLLNGDVSGIEYFEMALKLDPSNAMLLYQQGLSFFEYGCEEDQDKFLKLAGKRFRLATALNPHFFDAFHAWGNTLYLLGMRTGEKHYFITAKTKFKKTLSLAGMQSSDVMAELHWDYANVWARLAEYSGEATDLHIALKEYEKANKLQESLSDEFWIHFGEVCVKLGNQTNDLRFFLKGINCFKNSISIAISSGEAWLRLATAVKTLYEYTHDEDHFSQANECFATATQLSPKEGEIYFSWATLLYESGKNIKDVKRLRSAIEKCQLAQENDCEEIEFYGLWGEALASLGLLTDRLELIHEGQNKVQQAMEIDEESPEIWYSSGICLFSLGQYYNDLDTYYQAIEKFQTGLSINRANHKLWFALGFTYKIVAQIEQEIKSYEKACRFFSRALSLKVKSHYHIQYAITLSKLGEFSHNEKSIELSLFHFEQALGMQKNAVYLYPEWMFEYACCLDLQGDFAESESHYRKALEIFNHVLMVDPEFPDIHYRMALVYSHFGDLIEEADSFYRAIHYYKFAHRKDKENDQIILDWALTLVNLAEHLSNHYDSDQYYREAEYKMIQAARFGNAHAYYYLGCLYALLHQNQKAMRFLEKARLFDALPPLHELVEDEWLDGLQSSEEFQVFLTSIESHTQDH